MKKADRKRLDETLNKALSPPRRMPKQSLDALLDEYDDKKPEAQLSLAPQTSLVKTDGYARSETSLASQTSLVSRTGLVVDMMASLPPAKGYVRLYYQLTDHLYPLLDAYEQAVHVHLFRLSWGFGKPTCTIGLPRLSRRAGVSLKSAQRTVGRLEAKGLIRKLGMVIGRGKEQGIEFWVAPPTSLVTETSLVPPTSLVSQTTYKEKALKENTHTQVAPPEAAGAGVGSRFSLKQCIAYAEHRKASDPNMRSAGAVGRKLYETGREDELIDEWLAAKDAPRLDTSQCPDCHGTGMYYPEGIGKGGVKKCDHKRLKEA